jgi:hypothetical protein
VLHLHGASNRHIKLVAVIEPLDHALRFPARTVERQRVADDIAAGAPQDLIARCCAVHLCSVGQAEALALAGGVRVDRPEADLIAADRGGPGRRARQCWF